MVLIKIKNYEHYNRAMGKYISSRKHYKEEMARGGYINYDKAKEIAEKARKEGRKDYKPSAETRSFLNSLRPDKKGKVELSDRQIDYMKSKMETDDNKVNNIIKEADNG